MTFTEIEIEKAREIKRSKKITPVVNWEPKAGQFIHARHCPEGCQEIQPGVYLIVTPSSALKDQVWLMTIDELLEMAQTLQISFSFITDFIHRRRFADGKVREGIYQILIEKFR